MVRCPLAASASERLVAIVVLPAPPLPLMTAMVRMPLRAGDGLVASFISVTGIGPSPLMCAIPDSLDSYLLTLSLLLRAPAAGHIAIGVPVWKYDQNSAGSFNILLLFINIYF
jgi:hypothetical protein